MAVQGSGTKPMGTTIDPAMKDQTSFDARKGAPKRTQTNFPIHPTMVDQQKFSGASPGASGKGPDASSPDVMDPELRRTLKRQPQILKTPWDLYDNLGPNRSSLDANAAGRVLGDAVLSGSTKLPDAPALKTDSGKAPAPWPAEDRGG
jgi:hypothetical protein